MEASIVNLRYQMKDILKALDRNQRIKILYHGKEKGIISPSNKDKKLKVKAHPFFGFSKKSKKSVSQIMSQLRKPRYDF